MAERCIDASVVLKLAFKGEPYRIAARRLISDSLMQGIALIAPAFFESEVDSVIRKRTFDGRLSLAEGRRAYSALDRVPIRTVSLPNLRNQARLLAESLNQASVYDSTYAALAQLRGCEFWTADLQFYRAAVPLLAFVKYLPDYS